MERARLLGDAPPPVAGSTAMVREGDHPDGVRLEHVDDAEREALHEDLADLDPGGQSRHRPARSGERRRQLECSRDLESEVASQARDLFVVVDRCGPELVLGFVKDDQRQGSTEALLELSANLFPRAALRLPPLDALEASNDLGSPSLLDCLLRLAIQAGEELGSELGPLVERESQRVAEDFFCRLGHRIDDSALFTPPAAPRWGRGPPPAAPVARPPPGR
jgi:hypothetical protein